MKKAANEQSGFKRYEWLKLDFFEQGIYEFTTVKNL